MPGHKTKVGNVKLKTDKATGKVTVTKAPPVRQSTSAKIAARKNADKPRLVSKAKAGRI